MVRWQVCVFVMIWLITTFLACTSGSESTPENWVTDEDGKFYTNDLAKAKEEMPFSFAHPDYLPSDLTFGPRIVGTLADRSQDGRLFVEVRYQRGTESSLESAISINAYDHPCIPGNPGSNNGLKSVEINGISVMQFTESMDARRGNDWYKLEGFSFWWDQEGIYYEVLIFGYDEEEAVKIVKSMIQ